MYGYRFRALGVRVALYLLEHLRSCARPGRAAAALVSAIPSAHTPPEPSCLRAAPSARQSRRLRVFQAKEAAYRTQLPVPTPRAGGSVGGMPRAAAAAAFAQATLLIFSCLGGAAATRRSTLEANVPPVSHPGVEIFRKCSIGAKFAFGTCQIPTYWAWRRRAQSLPATLAVRLAAEQGISTRWLDVLFTPELSITATRITIHACCVTECWG